MDKVELDLFQRIAEALEQQARQGKSQLEAYEKSQAETLRVMQERNVRDLEQIERIKERHQWDREAHEAHMKKMQEEAYWREELEGKIKSQQSNIIK